MDCEFPEVLQGQTSINELLVAMGESPVEAFIPQETARDASGLFDDAPMLPGF